MRWTYTSTDCITAVVCLSNLGKRLRVLGWAANVNLILVHLDFEAGRQKRVKPDYQVRMTFEEI